MHRKSPENRSLFKKTESAERLLKFDLELLDVLLRGLAGRFVKTEPSILVQHPLRGHTGTEFHGAAGDSSRTRNRTDFHGGFSRQRLIRAGGRKFRVGIRLRRKRILRFRIRKRGGLLS